MLLRFILDQFPDAIQKPTTSATFVGNVSATVSVSTSTSSGTMKETGSCARLVGKSFWNGKA